MSIHSKIIIHWTGKGDIETALAADRPQLYVDRLVDYYRNGLFSRKTVEPVLRKLKIDNIVRLCFTEIRLSQAKNHADNYGRLGIGFTRDFILNRGGRPVIYIPFEAINSPLEESLKRAYENSLVHEEINQPLSYVLAFIKRMWNEHGEEHFEEMEWRIVYDQDPNNPNFEKGEAEGVYRFRFEARDVKVVIFPDEETKTRSLENEELRGFFQRHFPMIATLKECENF